MVTSGKKYDIINGIVNWVIMCMEVKALKLLVIDGNSIINRAFYGVRLLSNGNGQYTNGVYGFLNIFLKLVPPPPTGVIFLNSF